MTTSEIIDYVLTWWKDRKTIDKSGEYNPSVHAYDSADMEVVVKTPWDTFHTAIRVTFSGQWVYTPSYSCWTSMQYHFTGWRSINELNKRKLNSMMLAQRKILETSPTL